MTAADKKIKHPYTFCSKSVGMLLLFYAIMMLRNPAFAASEAVTTLPSACRCSQPHPLTGEIYLFRNQGMDIQKKLFLGMTLGMACLQKIIPEMQKTCSFQSRSACKN